MTHVLKIEPQFLNDILDGTKTFEIRKNDRDFHVGDVLRLCDLNRTVEAFVCYMLENAQEYGLMDGYVIMGIKI